MLRSSGYEQAEMALIVSFVLALISTLCALYIGEVAGQMPCVLCWYQRIAMFPLAIILGIAAYRNDVNAIAYALPISLIGLVIASWHVGLYVGVIPEPIVPCTQSGPSCTSDEMLFLGIPIPMMSMSAFTTISLLLIVIRRKNL